MCVVRILSFRNTHSHTLFQLHTSKSLSFVTRSFMSLALFYRLYYDLTALQDTSSFSFSKESYYKGVDLTRYLEDKVLVNVSKDTLFSVVTRMDTDPAPSNRRWIFCYRITVVRRCHPSCRYLSFLNRLRGIS